jgi:hypothetical protein
MSEAAGARERMGQATLVSLSIHVLAALAIPALAWTVATTPVETVSFTHILHIEIKPPRAPHPPPRALAPRHEAKATLNFANRVHLVATRPHHRATPDRALASSAPAAPAVAMVQQAGSGAANGAAAPDATPSPAAPAVASVGSRQTGGYLPFGAEQPDPVLDPSVRKALQGIGAHVTLIVTVGDDGKTQTVVFDPPIDPALESRIRALLADASWDPAVCGGGVACQGQATIKL